MKEHEIRIKRTCTRILLLFFQKLSEGMRCSCDEITFPGFFLTLRLVPYFERDLRRSLCFVARSITIYVDTITQSD